MSLDVTFAYPLRGVTDAHLQQLGRVLWDWDLCVRCADQPSCVRPSCPWNRAKRLGRFWNWYRTLTETYIPELIVEQPALRSHEDLRDIIKLIRFRPESSRAQLTEEYFASRAGYAGERPETVDQSRAFNLAASLLLMVNCISLSHPFSSLELGSLQTQWRPGISIKTFVSEAFPLTAHPDWNEEGAHTNSVHFQNMLAATSLKKRAGLRLEATNDLRSHLKLDRKKGTVLVYHHTAVLKENLLLSQRVDNNIERSPMAGGNIPRALALDTLDTIHKILFPSDLASQSLLQTLVSRGFFDEDCLRYESARYREDDENESSYHHFGSQLADLFEEVQNPTPRGSLHEWFERRSGARYVMMATMIGVFIAVVVGILGLAVACFQAWVSYQQWKHPVRGA